MPENHKLDWKHLSSSLVQFKHVRVVRKLVPALGASVGIQGTLVVSGIIVARALGVQDRGYLALLVLIPTVLYQVGGLGMPVATAFYLARDKHDPRAVVRAVMWPALIQTIVITAIHAGVLFAVVRDDPGRVRLAALVTLVFVPAAFVQQYGLVTLQGLRRHFTFNALRMLSPVLYATCAVALVVFGTVSLVAVTLAYLASFGVTAAITAVIASRSLADHPIADNCATGDAPPRSEMLRFGLRGLASSSSALEVFRIDLTLVAFLVSPYALGLYVVAVAFTNLPVFVAQSIGMAAYPEVAAQSGAAARETLWRYFTVNLVIVATVVGALELVIGRMLPAVFGAQFAPAVDTARLLLAAALLLAARRVLADGTRGAGHPGLTTLAEIAGWIVFVPLAVWLAGTRGPAGVAFSFALAAGASLAVLLIATRLVLRGSRKHVRIDVGVVRQLLLRRCVPIAVLVVVSGAFGLLLAFSTALPGVLLAVLVASFLALAAAVVRLDFRARRDMFSPLILLTGYYVLGFAVGSLYYWHSSAGLFTHRDLLWALVLGQGSWLLLVAGYLADPFRLVSAHIPKVATRGTSRMGIVVPLLAVGWLARVVLIGSGRYFHTAPAGSVAAASTGGSWLLSAASLLPTVAVAFVGAESRRGRRTFALLVAVEVAWYLPTGDRGSLISVALVLLAIRFYRTRRVPWKLLSVSAVIGVFIVLPFGLAYRGNNVDYQQHPRRQFVQAADQLFSAGFPAAVRSGFDATLSRFSDVASVAVVSERGPGTLDRPFGQTLTWGVTDFVPRAFMPSKPDPGRFGNEFGRKFGMISPTDQITSVAIGEPGEFWMSVGVGGLVLGMLFVGALYRVLDTTLSARGANAGATALYAVLIWPLIQSQGTIFAQGLVGCIKLLAFFALILVVIDAPSHVARTARSRGGAIQSGQLEGAL